MKEFDPYDRLNRGACKGSHGAHHLVAVPSVEPPVQQRVSPMDDPAVAIALAMAMRAICIHRGTRLPDPVIRLLASHVAAGDPACTMVMDLLISNGLVCNGLVRPTGTLRTGGQFDA